MDILELRSEIQTTEDLIISEISQQNYEIWRTNMLLLQASKPSRCSESLLFAVEARLSPQLDGFFSDRAGDPFDGCHDVNGSSVLQIAQAVRLAERSNECFELETLMDAVESPELLGKVLRYCGLALAITEERLASLSDQPARVRALLEPHSLNTQGTAKADK